MIINIITCTRIRNLRSSVQRFSRNWKLDWYILCHTCNWGTAVTAAISGKLTRHFLHDSQWKIKAVCRISWKSDGLVADTASQTSIRTLSSPKAFFLYLVKVVSWWWQLTVFCCQRLGGTCFIFMPREPFEYWRSTLFRNVGEWLPNRTVSYTVFQNILSPIALKRCCVASTMLVAEFHRT